MSKSLRFTEDDLQRFKARKTLPTIAKRSASVKRSVKAISHAISCHAKALGLLARFPVLKTGGLFRGKKIQANHEHWEQVIIFDYFERIAPEVYEHLAAIPNGGKRSKKTANEMACEGAKSGYPDMTLDLVRGRYHGMRIELKHEKGGNPSENQIKWLNRLHQQGYFVCLCYGSESAIRLIHQYVSLQPNESIDDIETMIKWLQPVKKTND